MSEQIWLNPKEVEPADNQVCHIIGRGNGWGCALMITNIPYKKGAGWLDIFSTPEAGSLYGPDSVAAWTPAEKIPMPPDEWLE